MKMQITASIGIGDYRLGDSRKIIINKAKSKFIEFYKTPSSKEKCLCDESNQIIIHFKNDKAYYIELGVYDEQQVSINNRNLNDNKLKEALNIAKELKFNVIKDDLGYDCPNDGINFYSEDGKTLHGIAVYQRVIKSAQQGDAPGTGSSE